VATTVLAIKVDVDTYEGTREGVPRLMDTMGERGVSASFFLSLGPDNSGKAVFRVFTRPGFLAKQLRTRAPSAFGWRTLLRGTILPAPIISKELKPLMDSLQSAGHEVGLHAWDHVYWHDRLWKMTPREAAAEVNRGISAFWELAGGIPKGFAAPAWRINLASVQALKDAGVVYTAATRGKSPYRPVLEGQEVDLPEIPSTLPTADEILGRDGIGPDDLADFWLDRISRSEFNVLTIHAEMEGRILAKSFAGFLDKALAQGIQVERLIDIVQTMPGAGHELPFCEVERAEVPGRSGRVSVQA
jgi:undecaprenyl phosphate-alpha-L-ara4FN deformylase